jgi:RNA polymerase primary sigma factor
MDALPSINGFSHEDDNESDVPHRGRTRASPEDTHSSFMSDVSQHDLLKPWEEKGLAQAIVDNNDEYARQKMAASNIRLVVSEARKKLGRGLGLQDLIGEGLKGLMYGIDKFRPSTGNRVSTYVTWWIRQQMGDAVKKNGNVLRIPSHRHEEITIWQKAEAELESKLKRPPTEEETRLALGWEAKDVEDVKKSLRLRSSRVDLDDDGADHTESLSSVLEDRRASSGDVIAEAMDEKEKLRRLLHRLDKREATILIMRFGLGTDGKAYTLREIGEALGITRERVRQIEAEALAKLRTQMEADHSMWLSSDMADNTVTAADLVHKQEWLLSYFEIALHYTELHGKDEKLDEMKDMIANVLPNNYIDEQMLESVHATLIQRMRELDEWTLRKANGLDALEEPPRREAPKPRPQSPSPVLLAYHEILLQYQARYPQDTELENLRDELLTLGSGYGVDPQKVLALSEAINMYIEKIDPNMIRSTPPRAIRKTSKPKAKKVSMQKAA